MTWMCFLSVGEVFFPDQTLNLQGQELGLRIQGWHAVGQGELISFISCLTASGYLECFVEDSEAKISSVGNNAVID